MLTVAVANFKGGVGKTTTSGFLAHAFQRMGYSTVAVDTDPDQASLTRWSERGWDTIPVAHLVHSAAGQIAGFVDPQRYDVAVVDTPPMELRRKITLDVLRQATDVVIPTRATFADWDGLPPMWPVLDEAEVDTDRASVLFTEVRSRVKQQLYRDLLDQDGRHALRTSVPALEYYAQALAGPIEISASDYYVLAAEEITQRGGWSHG